MKHKKGFFIFIAICTVAAISGICSHIKQHSGQILIRSFYNESEEFDEYDYTDPDDLESDSDSDVFKNIVLSRFRTTKNEPQKKMHSPYISVLHINGVISKENKTYNQKWLLRQIKNAARDKKNCGILLSIDSPGGTVYESDEAYLAFIDYKKNTQRPVYAYFGSLAASGGYYIGCAADTIFANRNSLTGSIGVIAGQSIDATALLEKIGIKSTTITAGKNKNMGNYDSVLTEEQRNIFQSIADEAYEQFTGIVAESRNLPISEVKQLADGRIYTATQAEKNGLVDFVCPLAEAKEKIQNQLDEKVEFIDCTYKYEESLFSFFTSAARFLKNPSAELYQTLGEFSGKSLYLYK